MADPAADGLIHVADYRWVTGDQTTPSANVEQALDDALGIVEGHCNRKFAYGEHTETLYVYRDGKCYPTNTPLASVSSPTNLGSTALQGAGVYLGVFLPTPAYINSGDWQAGIPPQSKVTYMGGYQPYRSGAGPTDDLPTTLVRALCRVAWLILHPVALPGVPAGAKSASVGDVSVTGDLSSFVAVDPSVGRDLKPYRKRKARGWQRA